MIKEIIIQKLNSAFHSMWWFIRNFIHPFLTPLFAVYNYEYLKKNLVSWLADSMIFLSTFYGALTFGIAIYRVISNIKNPPN
ncbi:hypothetical protein GvMRE_IIg459 [endosymbiont GvMRE of Glomus versiforme]|nr:hypothetical protein GvMRE_IIg459 [endosymbiont GvMRE of Glomus versiforme]